MCHGVLVAEDAIVGGTGAFVGARGVSGSGPSPQGVPARAASTQEDPSERRVNGGGVTRRVLTIYPMESPQILAIAHSSDFSLVSAARPVVPGEYLSIFASGLGPTRQGPDPGKPFPSSLLAQVNSPVAVTLNGTAVSAVQAVGYPGSRRCNSAPRGSRARQSLFPCSKGTDGFAFFKLHLDRLHLRGGRLLSSRRP